MKAARRIAYLLHYAIAIELSLTKRTLELDSDKLRWIAFRDFIDNFLQESPRWLVAKNKLYEAAEILNDLASDRWNNTGAKFSGEQLKSIPNDKSGKFYTINTLFCTRRLAGLSLLLLLSILSYSLINSVFLTDIDLVHINIYLHFALYGIFRVWVPIVAVVMDFKLPRFGRHHLFMTCCAAVGLCFGVVTICYICGVSTKSKALYGIALLGKSINVSGFYIAVSQITLVSYPTVARSVAFGTLTLTDDIGAVISEVFLAELLADWQPWPYVIAEIFVLLTFNLALWFLPETKFRSMPDTKEQVVKQESMVDFDY